MTAGKAECEKQLRTRAWVLAGLFLLLTGAPAAFAHRFEKKFNVSGRAVVAVRNDQGKISVKSWDQPEVQVIAEHQSDRVEVDAEQMGDRIEVTTHVLSQNASAADLKANYEIMVPEQAELQIKNDAGTIIVEHVAGDLTFETVLADVQLQEVEGYLLVKTVGGSLLCVRCAGRIEVNSISGNLKFIQPVSPNVRATTYSGSILFDGDFLPGGIYVLKNHKGPIEVLYTDSDSFELRATSLYGKVDREPSLNLKPPAHVRRPAPSFSNSLFGTFNSGAARVELTSFSGTISIRKR
jgi:DUF4097 and DUF4098 domain-containing protein YvlB